MTIVSGRFDDRALLLYAVTDRSWLGGRTLAHDVEEVLRGGATMIQLREKELDFEKSLAEAFEIKAVCKKYGVPFIVNDSVELALACGADGIHVGQSDVDARRARERLGGDKIVGVSAQTVEQAVLAEKSGADYLGVGAVFTTSTKKDADFVPGDTLRTICGAVGIPVVAIGGINAYNIGKLRGFGIKGTALISALFAEKNIFEATARMRKLSEETVK